MKFLQAQLHAVPNSSIYINLREISHLEDAKQANSCTVHFNNGRKITVAKSPEEILEALGGDLIASN